MDLILLRAFQRQVLSQCEFILYAVDDLNAVLRQRDTKRAFYALQNILNAAANVQKACWGQRGRHAVKRQPLRDSIGIADDSPFHSPDMRNNFEHFDERLDQWWNESIGHNYFDLSIMPRAAIEIDAPDIDFFRMFDAKTTDLYFWGERFNIQALVNECRKLLPKLQEEASKPDHEAQ